MKTPFIIRAQQRMRDTGHSFARVCREMGSRGGKRAAFLRRHGKQALARISGELRGQVERGLRERDSVPDEIFTNADKINISRENHERLTRLRRLGDGRLAEANLKPAEITAAFAKPSGVGSNPAPSPSSSLLDGRLA